MKASCIIFENPAHGSYLWQILSQRAGRGYGDTIMARSENELLAYDSIVDDIFR